MRMRLVLVLAFLLAPGLCLAQPSKRTAVAVSHSGEDQVGRAFAFALKEAIQRSSSFVLVEDNLTGPRIAVHLVSVDANQDRKGISSAVAITMAYDSLETPGLGILLNSSVIYCGSDKVETCAKRQLPNIDDAKESLRKSWPNLWKELVRPQN
jgi:hypothetical protein